VYNIREAVKVNSSDKVICYVAFVCDSVFSIR
jgi:hypothetical protein